MVFLFEKLSKMKTYRTQVINELKLCKSRNVPIHVYASEYVLKSILGVCLQNRFRFGGVLMLLGLYTLAKEKFILVNFSKFKFLYVKHQFNGNNNTAQKLVENLRLTRSRTSLHLPLIPLYSIMDLTSICYVINTGNSILE